MSDLNTKSYKGFMFLKLKNQDVNLRAYRSKSLKLLEGFVHEIYSSLPKNMSEVRCQ